MPSIKTIVPLFAAAATAAPVYGTTAPPHFVINTITPTDETYTTFKPVTAADGSFWISKPTKQYCPEGLNVTECTNDNFTPRTTFFYGVSNSLYLAEYSSHVQQVYVQSDGALRFTPAEGDFEIPKSDIQSPFTYIPETPEGGVAHLTGPGSGKFLGCPLHDGSAEDKAGFNRVYSDVPSAKLGDDCFEIVWSVFGSEEPGAFAYA